MLMLASVASMIDQFNMPNIRLLLEMGYEVHVACNFLEGNTCDRQQIQSLRKRLTDRYVVIHQWDCPRSVYAVEKCFRAYRQLCSLLDQQGFAWVHCHSPIGGAIARLAAYRKGIAVVYTAHGFHFYQGAPLRNWMFYYPVEKLLARWTDVLVTVNKEDYRLALKKLKAGKVWRIPGIGIDTAKFPVYPKQVDRAAFCRKYDIPKDAVILLSVGELSRRKNHQAVIKAVAGIQKSDVYYVICGQGPLRNKLMRLAQRYSFADHVRMVGFQKELVVFYRNADVFVFPSLQEGMPVALMEAMACGLPCVVSDIRGNRELIDRQGGCLFKTENISQIQKAILELIGDPNRCSSCGRYNQEKIKAYRIELIQKHMRRIYSQMDANVGNKRRNRCSEDRMHNSACNGHLPVISVIMAVYQAASSLELVQAVHSICRQTFQDWELIICDDGSTDCTWDILKLLAQKDSRIQLIRHTKNHGAAHARNTCIRAARGRYIAVMDADDISSPDRLEKQYTFLEHHLEYAFAGSRGEFFVHRIGDDGERYWYNSKPQAEDFLFSLPYVHASIMFRREALERVHGYDSSRRVIRVEDYDLLLRMCADGLHGANLRQVLYYIRRDKKQYKRRKYRYRFHEAYVKYRGFYALALMPAGYLYAAKPLVVGLFPAHLVTWMQRIYYGDVRIMDEYRLLKRSFSHD